MSTVGTDSARLGWPVLVTGAGGFVGGHIARVMAASGYRVRGLVRKAPLHDPHDPPIEWVVGDLRRPRDLEQAVAGTRGVVHTAGWVSLGSDRRGDSRTINVDATRALLDLAQAASVERFVFTSTLWTVAAGTRDEPATEATPWNLDCIRSPYCTTKREAEQLVLGRSSPGFATAVICPGLVIGSRDVRPTSTRVLLEMARMRVLMLPRGGIPVVDARVLALAHMRALETAKPGERYIVVGPYLSYPEMAELVARVAGRPKRVLSMPDSWERPLAWIAGALDRLTRARLAEVSTAAVAGGFLRLIVSGAKADEAFALKHPDPLESIVAAFEDHQRSGRASWLNLARTGASPRPVEATSADAWST
jgi:dihydroflavonol-4-reductase